MSMFPGASATIYTNEAGEVLGWDYESGEPEYDPYDDDAAYSYEDDYDDEFEDGPYKGRLMQCEGFPTPVHVRADDGQEWCVVVMYGDDRTHPVERGMLSPLGDDDDFCRGCGSYACGHGR